MSTRTDAPRLFDVVLIPFGRPVFAPDDPIYEVLDKGQPISPAASISSCPKEIHLEDAYTPGHVVRLVPPSAILTESPLVRRAAEHPVTGRLPFPACVYSDSDLRVLVRPFACPDLLLCLRWDDLYPWELTAGANPHTQSDRLDICRVLIRRLNSRPVEAKLRGPVEKLRSIMVATTECRAATIARLLQAKAWYIAGLVASVGIPRFGPRASVLGSETTSRAITIRGCTFHSGDIVVVQSEISPHKGDWLRISFFDFSNVSDPEVRGWPLDRLRRGAVDETGLRAASVQRILLRRTERIDWSESGAFSQYPARRNLIRKLSAGARYSLTDEPLTHIPDPTNATRRFYFQADLSIDLMGIYWQAVNRASVMIDGAEGRAHPDP